METATIIMLIGIALAAFNALVVIACVVKSAAVRLRTFHQPDFYLSPGSSAI